MDSEDALVRAEIQTLCAEAVSSVVGNSTEEHGRVTMQQVLEQCHNRACVIPASLTVQVTDDPLRSDQDIQFLLAVHSLAIRGATEGDTALNQAGIFMENPTQYLIGNRMANHFNGMF
jgi:hypothetical protein